jgi:DNA-binding transcriptional MerR regulator
MFETNNNNPGGIKLGIFSIKDVEAVSGIKSHTLRIWEQRYGIIQPKRTDTNIRYYDDEDLKFILNISILNKHGFKISEIAKMGRNEINEHILKLSSRSNRFESQIKSLISAMLRFDEYAFHQILTTNIIQHGLDQTMIAVVFPFLSETGLLWQLGSIHPSHEHFASNIIKQKLYVAIDGNVGKHSSNPKRFLLFLPEYEQHTLGLLFANYILRARGHEVLFLGQQVPLVDLGKVSGDCVPDFVFTILTAAHVHVDKETYINQLCDIWQDAKILLSGAQFLTGDFNYSPQVKLIHTMQEFINFVDTITQSGSFEKRN